VLTSYCGRPSPSIAAGSGPENQSRGHSFGDGVAAAVFVIHHAGAFIWAIAGGEPGERHKTLARIRLATKENLCLASQKKAKKRKNLIGKKKPGPRLSASRHRPEWQ